MEFLKSLFEKGAITWEQFQQGVADKGYKLADLSSGNYVSKHKYDDDVKSRDTTIEDLNAQITKRDTDISGLQEQLTKSGADNKTKVSDLTKQLEQLQADYSNEKQAYEKRLNKQSYEFAVREFANTQKFSSNAAKRDFISEMIGQNLQMKDNTILGADDFVKLYQEKNSDAFIKPEEQKPEEEKKPQFVKPTGSKPDGNDNPFASMFNFTGVRPHDKK